MSDPSAPPADAPGPAERFGRLVENLLLAVVLFTMIGLAATQVAMRGLLGTGFAWADEALRLLVLWAAMLGAIAASRDNAHLRIDLLSRFLPAAGRRWKAVVVDLFAAAVAGVLAWESWRFVAESREFGDEVLGAALPAWTVQAILPTAFVLIAYRYVAGLPRHFRPRTPGGHAAP